MSSSSQEGTLRLATPGVLVVGMHRSGTSAAARVVNLLGFYAGTDGDLMPAGPDNPAGYWESRTLAAFNDQLLLSLGGSWSALPAIPKGWEHDSDLAELLPVAYELAKAQFGTHPWVWKDPRVCVLLPFWRQALHGSSVLVLRNPGDVARSLSRRNGFTTELGLAIWERSMRQAVEGLRGMPVRVGSYEALLSDPVVWIRDVASFLTSVGFGVDAQGVERAAGSVRVDLRHHATRSIPATSVAGQTETVARLYDWLGSLVGPHLRFDPLGVGPEPDYVDHLLALHRASLADLPWQRGRQFLARGRWVEARRQFVGAAFHPNAGWELRLRSALGLTASVFHRSLEPLAALRNPDRPLHLRQLWEKETT